MNAQQVIELLQLVLGIARAAGINIERFQAMAGEDGQLTDEQVTDLINEAQDAVNRL